MLNFSFSTLFFSFFFFFFFFSFFFFFCSSHVGFFLRRLLVVQVTFCCTFLKYRMERCWNANLVTTAKDKLEFVLLVYFLRWTALMMTFYVCRNIFADFIWNLLADFFKAKLLFWSLLLMLHYVERKNRWFYFPCILVLFYGSGFGHFTFEISTCIGYCGNIIKSF